MNGLCNEEVNNAVLQFANLAKRTFENGSFFKLYKIIFAYLRETEEDMTIKNPAVSFTIATFEHVLTGATECPNCRMRYQFRHSISDKDRHGIEIHCECCGDHFSYSEEKETETYYNINVMNKIASYNRRRKSLRIKTFRGDLFHKAKLVWEGDDLPVLWLNINNVRKVDEVEAFWHQCKKEVQKRNRLRRMLLDNMKTPMAQ